MTRFLAATLIATIAAATAAAQPASAPAQPRLYELRTYHAAKGKFDALQARFRDHSLRLFQKHGMTNVGYWTSADGDDSKVVFLLAHPDRAARDRAWAALAADPEWQQVKRSGDVMGKIVDRIEEVFLTPVELAAPATTPKLDEGRVFELRVYAGRPVADLLAKSKDVMQAAKKDGVTPVGTWTLAAGQPGADSTVVTIQARNPSAAPRKRGAVLESTLIAAVGEGDQPDPTVRKTELLRPTDYSPLK